MTQAEIDAITARWKSLPDEKWEAFHNTEHGGDGFWQVLRYEPDGESYELAGFYDVDTPPDLTDVSDRERNEFLAHSRTDIPALIEEVKRLRYAIRNIYVYRHPGFTDIEAHHALQVEIPQFCEQAMPELVPPCRCTGDDPFCDGSCRDEG